MRLMRHTGRVGVLLIGVTLIGLTLAGCSALPVRDDTPSLPPNVYGINEDNDIGAINFAAWAFASPDRTRGNPVNGARAAIAVEYLASELIQSPRWIDMSPMPKQRMLQARADLRSVLGIAPAVPPQEVVNVLLAVAWNLQTGNQPAALQALAAPGFVRPPPETLQILASLPYIPSANVATAGAAAEELPNDSIWR